MSLRMRPSRTSTTRVVAVSAITAAMLLGAPIAARAADAPTDPALIAFTKTADATCLTAKRQMAESLPTYEKHKAGSKSVTGGSGTLLATPKEVQAYIKANLGTLEGQQKKLKLLQPPAKFQGDITKLFAAADKALAEIKKDPARTPFTDPLRPVAQQARTLGFQECYQSNRPS